MVALVAAVNAGFSNFSSLLGGLVHAFDRIVSRLDGGLDSSNSDFGTSRGRSQGLFNQTGNLGVGFSNLGFNFFSDLVFGFGSDGDHVA
jgi:hypothetical protein